MGFGSVNVLVEARDAITPPAHVSDIRATARHVEEAGCNWVSQPEYREDAGAWFVTATAPPSPTPERLDAFTALRPGDVTSRLHHRSCPRRILGGPVGGIRRDHLMGPPDSHVLRVGAEPCQHPSIQLRVGVGMDQGMHTHRVDVVQIPLERGPLNVQGACPA